MALTPRGSLAQRETRAVVRPDSGARGRPGHDNILRSDTYLFSKQQSSGPNIRDNNATAVLSGSDRAGTATRSLIPTAIIALCTGS